MTGDAGPGYGHGDRVAVTGASGFIGSAVTRALLARGASVRGLVEPGADLANLADVDVERVDVDVRDAEGVRRALRDCRAVLHVAALYRFWARDPRQFYDVNVGGTLNVMEAARAAGVERMVYTSTVGTLGLDAARRGVAADEHSFPDVSHLFGSYKRSKYVAEHEVLRAAAQGLPVSIVMPTFPLGPRDRVPTPTGRLVLDYLNGRVPGYVDTTLNVAHVDDVAAGHVLALERGETGRSYILGGENYSLQGLLGVLAAATGLPEARLRVPRAVSLGVAHVSEFVEGRLLRRHPSVPLEAARMSTTHMAFDDSRARKELGYSPRPASEAIESSARWFVDNGYVTAGRQAKITWGAPS
ncbi:MAG TPA: hopanoid-associated sugar epimerase [Acidimicrobiales bacterium]|nr:hopanoid-associated sugar epimerase [Acidimicrobiales bacterium]